MACIAEKRLSEVENRTVGAAAQEYGCGCRSSKLLVSCGDLRLSVVIESAHATVKVKDQSLP